MGNRHGSQKTKEVKTKEEKKRDKDQEKQRKKEKKEKKKKRGGQHDPGLDTDFDESSHMTGGDSESCVFHSAENVSSSPYLDASTRSELEQGATWSGVFESHPAGSNHPKVLSSKDFRDGFSLEACIPPEIARPDTYDDVSSRFEARSGSSVKSSSASHSHSRHATPTSGRTHQQQEQYGDDAASVGTSSQVSGGGGAGYSTPLLSTPVFGRVERSTSPTSPASVLPRVQEMDPDDSLDIVPSKSFSIFHHPHFFNHQQKQKQQSKQQQQQQHNLPDFRNLPKPTSPYPQRRALSPKMTSSPFKLISSDDSSSSPTTPVPQRRAANLLDLFRTGTKSEKAKKTKAGEKKQSTTGFKQNGGKSDSSTNESEQGRFSSRPLWKTWERASTKKSEKQSKISIFGTTRKSEKKKSTKLDKGGEEGGKKSTDKSDEKRGDSVTKISDESDKSKSKHRLSSSTSSSSKFTWKKDNKNSRTSSRSSDSNLDASPRGTLGKEVNRNSSPPVAKSAAFCIMRLEELERSIEETIREKFPDAEPFLLKKRTKDEELKGSRSLPTTPSLKKKLYVSRDTDNSRRQYNIDVANSDMNAVSSKLTEVKDANQYCEDESLPSPTMSPVILRRFGARTRHASISPKIQRAKTAALYNSPSEMSRLEASKARKTFTKVPLYHAISSPQHQSHQTLAPDFIKPLTAAQKSVSKYDNVSDESEQLQTTSTPSSTSSQNLRNTRLVRQRGVEEMDSDEDSLGGAYGGSRPGSNQNPVIVPTFSAVFGSVSPKLKRHLETKFEDINKEKKKKAPVVGQSPVRPDTLMQQMSSRDNKSKVSSGPGDVDVRSLSFDTAFDSKKPTYHPRLILPPSEHYAKGKSSDKKIPPGSEAPIVCASVTETRSPLHTSVTSPSASASGSSGVLSVKERIKSINKSVSEGWVSPSHAVGTQSNTGTNLGMGEGFPRQSSGKTHDGEASGVTPYSPDLRNTGFHADLKPSSQKRGDSKAEATDNSSKIITSPGAARKHSNDHVVFGSAVALPCRLYACAPISPTSPGPEATSSVNNSQTAHAHDTFAGQSQNVRYVKKHRTVGSGEDKGDESKPYCSTTSVRTTSAVDDCVVSVINSGVSVPISVQSRGVDSQFKQPGTEPISKQRNGSQVTGENSKQSENEAVTVTSDVSLKGQSSLSDPNVLWESSNEGESVYAQQQKDRRKQLEDSEREFQPSYREDEQRYVVCRQPLSRVISDMINTSKQEEKQTTQEKQLRQSSPTSPDLEVKRVESSVAVVTTPTFEQPCLMLEEKTVRSDSSLSLPSSPLNTKRSEGDFNTTGKDTIYESRSQEIQTDSYTTADKGVDSKGLYEASERAPLNLQLSRVIPDLLTMEKGQHQKIKNGNPTLLADPEDSDESEFLKMVLASKQVTAKKETALQSTKLHDSLERAPPPPSPTAMQQLMEEFEEEEEEDEEAQEKKEIDSAMRKESEMKQFTDKIFKRLSNLLGVQSGDDNEVEDDEVFEEDEAAVSKKTPNFGALLTKLEENRDSFSSELDEEDDFSASASAMSASKNLSQARVLTIDTSSSLTTTTESESDEVYEPPQAFQNGQNTDPNVLGDFDGAEGAPKRKTGPNVFVFPEWDKARNSDSGDARQRRSSREYHSDDDVATGRGIPDYYDDTVLWSRRQKPPGQLSVAMMAIRRRERRERWLKKRRRNKTDLLSTGSSDTGSEYHYGQLPPCPPPRRRTDSNSFDYDEEDDVTAFDRQASKDEMGSGILTSPKYSKPILPFFGDKEGEESPDEKEKVAMKIASERLHMSLDYRQHDCRSNSDDNDERRRRKNLKDKKQKRNRDSNSDPDNIDDEEEDDFDDEDSDDDERGKARDSERFSSGSNLAIPGIEETFNELKSVQHILEGMQDRQPITEATQESKFMPLTTENVKSIREYYKDCYSSGSGRRSRMSATDRTESDLDLYSETRDDASTDSNVYADDEEDEDGVESYNTADDDLGAVGGSSSTDLLGGGYRDQGDEDSDSNFVVSCTFYNSNAFPPSAGGGAGSILVPSPPAAQVSRQTSASRTPTAQASVLNSDEEFWAGSAAFEESYKQLESAADAVSSTFQNAREQMHDIQHHLQALRRQMEGLQDDLVSTSMTLTPDMSLESTENK